jgi:heme exporter protein D
MIGMAVFLAFMGAPGFFVGFAIFAAFLALILGFAGSISEERRIRRAEEAEA